MSKGIHLTLSTNQGPNTGSRMLLFDTIVKNDGGFSLVADGVVEIEESGWYVITAHAGLTAAVDSIHSMSVHENISDTERLRSSQPYNLDFFGTLLSGSIYLEAGGQVCIWYYTGTSTVIASTGGQTLLKIIKLI